uniref:Spermatosis associated 4 n=1 Tax=Pseudonaja textilis TaxID=8673 RepID=A0A670Y2Q7_PSETE
MFDSSQSHGQQHARPPCFFPESSFIQFLKFYIFISNRDFSNGYLIAEIFSRYFPEDIHMHSFVNGTSLSVKLSNWTMLEKFFTKRNLKPTRELIDGTIHCKPGAAEIFVQDIYTMLTNSRIKHIQEEKIDFTDRIYQDNLPPVARSTASRAIKNNISLTEIMAEPDIYKNKQKINTILDIHRQRRKVPQIGQLTEHWVPLVLRE